MTRFNQYVVTAIALTLLVHGTNSLKMEIDSDYDPQRILTTSSSSSRLLRSPSSITDPRSIETKPGVCTGYSGILKVNSGDRWAASGTAFFLYMVNQIMYAEEHNLIPWAHFTDTRSPVYDPGSVHDEAVLRSDNGGPVRFKALVGMRFKEIKGEGDMECMGGVTYVGAPDWENSELEEKVAEVDTTGVWEVYFEPISAFDPKTMSMADLASCADKPFVDLDGYLHPGLHLCAPWPVRSWVYEQLPKAIKPNVDEPRAIYHWLGNFRKEGNRIINQYVHPKPWLTALVDQVNPIPTPNIDDDNDNAPPCLAMHIRHTDKGGNRRIVNVDEFLPYARIFVENGGDVLYLATDSIYSIMDIEKHWPEDIQRRIRRQEDAFRSSTKKSVVQHVEHHRSNTEALTDIYAMARCGLFLHGYSGMAEAVIYINGDLHRYGVNLEDLDRPNEVDFTAMVHEVLSKN